MFDLIQGKVDRPLHDGKTAPAAVSILVHVTVIGLVLAVPFLYVTDQLPEVPAMMAFGLRGQRLQAPAPPPPPPPPAPAVRQMQAPDSTKSVPTPSPSVAPVEAPSQIKAESPMTEVVTSAEGGVEGGVVGGVAGGVPGGLVGMPPPPPPPPAPPAGPVHIGGQVKALCALLHRVEPVYPDVAVLAKVDQGPGGPRASDGWIPTAARDVGARAPIAGCAGQGGDWRGQTMAIFAARSQRHSNVLRADRDAELRPRSDVKLRLKPKPPLSGPFHNY